MRRVRVQERFEGRVHEGVRERAELSDIAPSNRRPPPPGLPDDSKSALLRSAIWAASGARVALILAPAEFERGVVKVKNLQSREEKEVAIGAVVDEIQTQLRG